MSGNEEFCKNLREIMDERGLTQVDVAELSGFHPSTVYKWFRKGQVPQEFTVQCVADGLGVSVERLLG